MGEQVDSVMAEPSALQLRAGDSVYVRGTLRLHFVDRQGTVVEGAVPLYAARGPAKLRAGWLVAIAPGEGTLMIRPSTASALRPDPPGRPLTRVPVRITVR